MGNGQAQAGDGDRVELSEDQSDLMGQGMNLIAKGLGGLEMARSLLIVLDAESHESGVRQRLITKLMPAFKDAFDVAARGLITLRAATPDDAPEPWEQLMQEMGNAVNGFELMFKILDKYVDMP